MPSLNDLQVENAFLRQRIAELEAHLPVTEKAQLTRFDLATRAAHIGVWDWDITNNILVWDDQMYALYGLKKGDFGGAYEAWLHGLHPDDIESSNQESLLAQRGEKAYDTEFRVIWPDGSIHHLKAYGDVLRDEAGSPTRMIGVNFDITPRKQAESRIRHLSRLYATLSQINQAIVRAKDPHLLYSQICDIAIQFGEYRMAWIGLLLPESDVLFPYVSRGVSDPFFTDRFINTKDTALAQTPLVTALRENRVVTIVDLPNSPISPYAREKARELGYASQAVLPFRRGGVVVGLLVIYSGEVDQFTVEDQRLLEEIGLDISFALDALETEAQRSQSEQKVIAALEEKETLLREVHHRVKNNLQAIIALMEMQSMQIEDEAMKQFLKELQGQARTMALVYEQLYQSETLAKVAMEPYLFQLVTSVTDTFARGRSIQLDLEFEGVYMDVAQAMPCGLIVNELVTNVFKHAFPPGFADPAGLNVSLKTQGNSYRIRVADNGVGIPAGVDVQAGRSLGLRLVNLWATHQLGGTIELCGPPGTCFTVTFEK